MTTVTFSFATLSDWIGKELGTSPWVTVDQDRINEFARSTGDHQWIHVDVERAKRESPFGGPVAHGYLTLSLLADASMNVGVVPKDAVAVLNYGLDKVRFLAPVKAGSRLRTHIAVAMISRTSSTAIRTAVAGSGNSRIANAVSAGIVLMTIGTARRMNEDAPANSGGIAELGACSGSAESRTTLTTEPQAPANVTGTARANAAAAAPGSAAATVAAPIAAIGMSTTIGAARWRTSTQPRGRGTPSVTSG